MYIKIEDLSALNNKLADYKMLLCEIRDLDLLGRRKMEPIAIGGSIFVRDEEAKDALLEILVEHWIKRASDMLHELRLLGLVVPTGPSWDWSKKTVIPGMPL